MWIFVVLLHKIVLFNYLWSLWWVFGFRLTMCSIIPSLGLSLLLMEFKLSYSRLWFKLIMFCFMEDLFQLLKLKIFYDRLTLLYECFEWNPLIFVLDFTDHTTEQIFNLVINLLKVTVIFVKLPRTIFIQFFKNHSQLFSHELSSWRHLWIYLRRWWLLKYYFMGHMFAHA